MGLVRVSLDENSFFCSWVAHTNDKNFFMTSGFLWGVGQKFWFWSAVVSFVLYSNPNTQHIYRGNFLRHLPNYI